MTRQTIRRSLFATALLLATAPAFAQGTNAQGMATPVAPQAAAGVPAAPAATMPAHPEAPAAAHTKAKPPEKHGATATPEKHGAAAPAVTTPATKVN